jgi:MFS family permease
MKSPQMEAVPVQTDAPTPLFRNRNYNILWSSHFLSEFGSEITFIAFPLLILAVSGSPLQMGLVASVLAAARMVANVPAGVLADRVDRKKIMLGCQAVRVVSMASLVLALAFDAYSLSHVLVVAAVEGLFSSVFGPSEDAALPQVVPRSQLSTAVARNTARPFVASLLGPVVAGVLFAVAPVTPFAVNTTLLAFSVFALLFLTLPRRARALSAETGEKAERATIKGDVIEGFRWVLGNRVIRTTLAWVVFFNLVFHALIIVILAAAGENQVGAGEMGLMMAFLGAGGLLGAVLASRLHAALPSS